MVMEDLPAVLLSPAWEHRGAAEPAELNQSFDVPAASLGGCFSLCASVQSSSEAASVDAGRILQKGEAPAGWLFAAPGSSGAGVVAFAAGPREASGVIEEDAGQDAEAAVLRRADDVGRTRVDDGQWHHVAVVFACSTATSSGASGRLRVFVDGQLDGEVVLEVSPAPSACLMLGAPAEVAAPASLRDVQAFSIALTDQQVADIAGKRRDLPTGIPLVFLPAQVAEYWRLRASAPDEATTSPLSGGGDEARTYVQDALELNLVRSRDFQDDVTSSLFVDLLNYAQSICLTPRKTAVFTSIMHHILATMRWRSETTTCVGEPYSLSECFAEYKRLLVAHTFAAAANGHAKDRLGVFKLPEVRRLTDFVSSTLFQHYCLYQNVLVCLQESVTRHAEVVLEHPLPPPDLRRAKLRVGGDSAYSGQGLSKVARSPEEAAAFRAAATGLLARDLDRQSAAAAQAKTLADGGEGGEGDAKEADEPPKTMEEHLARIVAGAEVHLQAKIDERDLKLHGGGS